MSEQQQKGTNWVAVITMMFIYGMISFVTNLAARRAFPKLEVEIEVESIRECESALKAKPEWIMLDNMSCADMKKCVRMCRGISKTEASGGITLERAREVAATGVTAISLGCLTHSAGSVDLSLEWRTK